MTSFFSSLLARIPILRKKTAALYHDQETLLTGLLDVFHSHDVHAYREGEWLCFPGKQERISGRVCSEKNNGSFIHCQLDFLLLLGDGRVAIESFAGIGGSRFAAVKDGFENFLRSSFHVFLHAYFENDGCRCNQISEEEWMIAGKPRKVTLGGCVGKGILPNGAPPIDWYPLFESAIKQQPLPPGDHWIRLFCAQSNGQIIVRELLFDNEAWPDLGDMMATIELPASPDYYSVRLFLMVQDR